MADDFTTMGISAPKMLELEGAFSGIATAIGLSSDIATYADDVAIIADKLARRRSGRQ